MSNRSSIVVLLAAYNGMKWIEEQVDSILAQQGINVDIYISVDLSTDGTYEWCQDLAEQNTCVKVLPYGERFGGAAKNFYRLMRDVNLSNYEYISFSDQDDIWLPNKLSVAVQAIKNKRISVFSSNLTAFFLDGRELLIDKSQPQKKLDYLFEAGSAGCTYVFKSDALQQFKEFLMVNWGAVNDVELHDWMVYAYCRKNNLSWYVDDNPLIRYRIHESNQMGANSGLKAYQKRLSMIKNGWYRGQVESIRLLVNPDLRLNRLFLIKNFWQLRRQAKEAVILLVLLILGIY